MSVFQHPCYAAEIPLMSSCSELVVTEFSSSRIKSLRELLFQKERLVIEGVGFSPFRRLVCEIARTSHGLKPSFYELDLCVRALLLDENVGYVPPFIVLFETGKDGKARTLFTRASHVPSPWILDSLPKTCGSSTCTDSDCIGLWRNEESQSLTTRAPWSGMSSALIITSCATFGDARSKCRWILRQVR
ncbi:hypothetical protein EV421DRAFT_2038128 [Armillaria borealis]|uniref:Uncharacterized protein n=1 Tax=Armillaria borealis TaxID=47425 RepID=A0AA39MKG3_9AGAR|nr:hypothetical protein EV421DRAFT_2038128 [Armillaria borealis]